MNTATPKILMLLENHYPQDSRVMKEAVALTGAGYQVVVLAVRGSGQTRREIIDGVTVYRIRYFELFAKSSSSTGWLQVLLYRIKSAVGYIFEYFYFTSACLLMSIYLAFKEGFDAIHAHNPPNTLFIVGAFWRLFAKKYVFDHHDVAPELYLSRYRKHSDIIHKVLILEETLCLKFANMVIATNESYREIEVKRGSISPGKIFIVRNGPDLKNIAPVPPDEKLKDMNRTILAYLGIMGPQDGVDYLLRALHALVYKLNRTDFYCVIMGKGDALENLKELAHKLEINEYVWFTGFLGAKDWIRYLSTADICVDPSPSSPYSAYNDVSTCIKIMEYMALSKPIVGFDLKETRYSAGESALYAPPNEEEEFARAIARLMDEPKTRERMGREGRRRVEQMLAWKHVSRNLITGYDWLFNIRRTGKSATNGSVDDVQE